MNNTEFDEDIGFGITNTLFKWNAVKNKEEDVKLNQGKSTNGSWESSPSSGAAASDVVSLLDDEDHRFELRDIDVMFPKGELTVVMGPTASGKTTLLVCSSHYFSTGKYHMLTTNNSRWCSSRWHSSLALGELWCQKVHARLTSTGWCKWYHTVPSPHGCVIRPSRRIFYLGLHMRSSDIRISWSAVLLVWIWICWKTGTRWRSAQGRFF